MKWFWPQDAATAGDRGRELVVTVEAPVRRRTSGRRFGPRTIAIGYTIEQYWAETILTVHLGVVHISWRRRRDHPD